MALRRIIQSQEEYVQPDDLPWANVYVKQVTDMDISYVVKAMIAFDSGLMVITPCFKAFIHEGSQLHKFLIEALEIFVTQEYGAVDLMFVVLRKKGKIDVMVDDEVRSHMWHKLENKYVQVVRGEVSSEQLADPNPFLAGMGLRSDARKTETIQQGGVPKIESKVSRRGIKAV
jgi:hypothetical protein